MRFDRYDIAPEIKQNLMRMGFFRTTDIQFKTIPAIKNGDDVLAIAQTGTGKTAAFAIPLVHQIHSAKAKKCRSSISCLVLVPTRELAEQIGAVFSKLTPHTRVSSLAIYGGVVQDPQIEKLRKGVDILIATPGRMFDLIHQGHVDPRQVKVLVLDEADHMLDKGFIEDIKSIKRKLTQKHQTLFFSATINPTIKKLAYSQIRSNALRIQVSPEKMISKNITHGILDVPMEEKRFFLVETLKNHPAAKVLVFVRTQVRVERVQRHLQKNSMEVAALHGGMTQPERDRNLLAFRQTHKGVLVATDVSARGIDLPGISHVINYDLPDEPENYIHRVGRTGRGFSTGQALSFCSSEESEKLHNIEKLLQTKIQKIPVAEKKLPEYNVENLEISEILEIEESLFSRPKKSKRKKAK